MKLSTFQIKIAENPWNELDPKEHKDFQDKRDQQVKNWRDVVYKDIDLSPEYSGTSEKMPDDYFKHGKIDDEKAEKSNYCDSCGTMLDRNEKCYFCNEIEKPEEKEEDKKEKK